MGGDSYADLHSAIPTNADRATSIMVGTDAVAGLHASVSHWQVTDFTLKVDVLRHSLYCFLTPQRRSTVASSVPTVEQLQN